MKTTKEQIAIDEKISRFNDAKQEKEIEFIKMIQKKLKPEDIKGLFDFMNIVPEIELFEGMVMTTKAFASMKDDLKLKGQPVEVYAVEKRSRDFAAEYTRFKLERLLLPVTHTEVEVEDTKDEDLAV